MFTKFIIYNKKNKLFCLKIFKPVPGEISGFYGQKTGLQAGQELCEYNQGVN